MEGLKCPICFAISQVGYIKDGELFTCQYCTARFTVTAVRRYFLYPHKRKKPELNIKNFEELIANLAYPELLMLLRTLSQEMDRRYPQSENKMG